MASGHTFISFFLLYSISNNYLKLKVIIQETTLNSFPFFLHGVARHTWCRCHSDIWNTLIIFRCGQQSIQGRVVRLPWWRFGPRSPEGSQLMTRAQVVPNNQLLIIASFFLWEVYIVFSRFMWVLTDFALVDKIL